MSALSITPADLWAWYDVSIADEAADVNCRVVPWSNVVESNKGHLLFEHLRKDFAYFDLFLFLSKAFIAGIIKETIQFCSCLLILLLFFRCSKRDRFGQFAWFGISKLVIQALQSLHISIN